MKDYHINIFYSDEDGGYIADFPDLAHCSAFGETPEAALVQALIAQKAWLEAAKAEHKPIPRPKYRPAIYQLAGCSRISFQLSGQIAGAHFLKYRKRMVLPSQRPNTHI